MAWIDEVASYHEADQIAAFLAMISHAEGTDRYGDAEGYNVLVGGELFYDYSDHPNRLVQLSPSLASTAAGRYQILYRWWKPYKQQLRLPDFSPDSQDRYAIQQLREQDAYDDVVAGRVEDAIRKCANIWASFPGAGYGQREVAMRSLIGHFESNGGFLA